MTPTMPDAGSRWPRSVCTEPTSSGASSVCDSAKTRPTAPDSTEPAGEVPVPCASTYWMSSGARRAAASAPRTTFSCTAPSGAAGPAPSPSCARALPRTRASTVSPCRVASPSRLRTTTPQPSASFPATRGRCGASTPPHSAMSVSPARSPRTARCRATSEDELAVSTLRLGPRQPRKYDSRPDSAHVVTPAARGPSGSSYGSGAGSGRSRGSRRPGRRRRCRAAAGWGRCWRARGPATRSPAASAAGDPGRGPPSARC